MPPRGVKKGTKRERQYEAIKGSVKERGALGVARRGDRGAHGQQGAGARRRVAHGLAHLDAGHLLRPARRAALGLERAPRAHARAALQRGARSSASTGARR